jgi:Domain of unknown function (DUF4340)
MGIETRSELKLTKTLAGAAGLLAIVTLATAPRNVTPSAFVDQGESFFPDFKDPNEATTLEVVDFDADTAAAKPFKVTNDHGRWTIPSHHGYPADGKDRLAKTAAGIITIKKDEYRTDNVADQEALGVIDPLDEKATSLRGRGKRVTVKGENDKVLADLIIGNPVEGREGFHFVRVPDQKRVYAAKIDVDISTKFQDWIEKDLLQVEQSKIDRVVLEDYSIDERTLMVDVRDTVELDKKDGTWTANKMRPNQEVDNTKMNDLLREVDQLGIVGVRPKPEGITERLSGLTISRDDMLSLQSRGYYLTRDGNLMSNEGELRVHTDDGVLYTLRFGEILYGRGDAISAGAESTGNESAGPGENRYLFISAEFDPTVFHAPPKPANMAFEGKDESKMTDEDKANKKLDDAYKEYEKKVKDAKEKADGLATRFAPWYYVISSSSFEKIHLNRSALLKTKEEKAKTTT